MSPLRCSPRPDTPRRLTCGLLGKSYLSCHNQLCGADLFRTNFIGTWTELSRTSCSADTPPSVPKIPRTSYVRLRNVRSSFTSAIGRTCPMLVRADDKPDKQYVDIWDLIHHSEEFHHFISKSRSREAFVSHTSASASGEFHGLRRLES